MLSSFQNSLLIFLGLMMPFNILAQMEKGVFDASVLSEKESISLNGTWQFYPGKYINYEDFLTYPSRSLLHVNVPATWNSQGLSGNGFGTYRLKVKNLPSNGLLAINMPNLYSSYRLYIDDVLLAENGTPGTDRATTTPQWLMKTAAFKTTSTDAEIIIHVANFHHYRGGIHKPIQLGNFDTLQKARETELLSQMMVVAGLFVLAIFFFALFFIRRNNKSQHILFFSLLCLAWAGRTFFAHIYLRSFYFEEMDWLLHIRLEYIFLYSSLIFGNLFIIRVFNLPRSLALSSILMINMLFILITMALPSQVFTAFLPFYLGFAVVNFGYIIYAVVNAILKSRPAAWIAGSGIILAIVIFCTEIIFYQMEWEINHTLLQAAYLGLFIINSFILAHEYCRQDRKIEELEQKQQSIFKPLSQG